MLISLKKVHQALIAEFHCQPEAILVDIFLPLMYIDPTLPKHVIDYVLTGQNCEVLLALDQIDKSLGNNLLADVGHISPFVYVNFDVPDNEYDAWSVVLDRCMAARTELYTTELATLKPVQCMRYGLVLATICQGHNMYITTDKTPLWFLTLLHDGLITTIEGSDAKLTLFEKRPQWNAQILHSILQSDSSVTDVATALLSAVFERDMSIPKHYAEYFDALHALADLSEYATEHFHAFKVLLHQAAFSTWPVHYLSNEPKIAALSIDTLVKITFSQPKKIAKHAEAILMQLPIDICEAPLNDMLQNGTNKQKSLAADIMAKQGHNKTLLETALLTEKSKVVQESLRTAISRLSTPNHQEQKLMIPSWEASVPQSLPSEQALSILVQNHQDLLAEARLRNEPDDDEYNIPSRFINLSKVTQQELKEVIRYLNGETDIAKATGFVQNDLIFYQNRLCDLPTFNLTHYVRAQCYVEANQNDDTDWSPTDQSYWHYRIFNNQYFYLIQNKDLRLISHEIDQANVLIDTKRCIAEALLVNFTNNYFFSNLSPESIWPFFAENIEYLDEALGFSLDKTRFENYKLTAKNAFKVLHTFPALPEGYFNKILEMALGKGRLYRHLAQELLNPIPNIHIHAEEALQSSKQEIRICAAKWLGQRQQTSSAPHLYAALKKEKREMVQATLLSALENLGEDINIYLNPEALLIEAEKGLKAKRMVSFTWFDARTIPAMTWQDGQAVHPSIAEWWLVLAAKLKEPAGNLLLQRYVGLLSSQSAQDLGNFVLSLFLARDTRQPTEEEIMDHVLPQVNSTSLTSAEKEEAIATLRRRFIINYSPTAIADKGILALVLGVDADWAVAVIQQYMKKYPRNRQQIDAMLMAITQSNKPSIISFIISIARYFRTKSVQRKAKILMAQIAEQQDCDALTLADKYIGTAGLNDTGVQYFDYGGRVFTARIGQDLQFILQSPDGKIIQALPKSKQTENETLVEVAKKMFNHHKSQLNQIITLQNIRLYDAMCATRKWPILLWQAHLLNQPVMKHLISRLVWLNIDEHGQLIQTFRPAEDGCLLNLNDEEVQLPANSQVMLAHRVLLDNHDIELWQSHFQDYKITPLFSQFTHGKPTISQICYNTDIVDKEGWQMDINTLNRACENLNYLRESQYSTLFEHKIEGLDISIIIHFHEDRFNSGNAPIFLGRLEFIHHDDNNETRTMDISHVPDIVLAEGYAAYTQIAEMGSGFNPEWNKIE